MKKKILSLFIIILILTVILTGCKGSTKLEYAYTGSEMSRDPLVICVDLEGSGSSMNLFEFPQKSMENGLFLPLDDYMENHAQFADWDKQEQVILEAGRNDEGQQIIPLDYSFGVQVHPKSSVDLEKPDHPVTFEEALSDPELSELYSVFYNCSSNFMYGGEINEDSFSPGLACLIMGMPADFEKEELGFTEEELLSVMDTMFSLPKDQGLEGTGTGYKEIIDVGFLPQYDQPFTILPLYTTDGVLHANISSFIAINRNTKRPEGSLHVFRLFYE